MAAKPKLTPEQKETAKRIWEADGRKGFAWLIEELGLSISQEGMRLIAKSDGWAKGGKPSLEKSKTKLGKEKQSLEKQPTKTTTNKTVLPEKTIEQANPEWEVVEEQAPKKLGRPTAYMPSYDKQAYQLCLLGATDAELADFFEVAESTINLWKLNYITFSESIKAGKVDADARAAKSLFKRATGYRYEEVKTKQVRPVVEEDGVVQAAGDEMITVEVVTTVKEMPPDTSAAFLWLKNRRPKDWRDKIEVENTAKLDTDMLERLKTEMIERMAAARERQHQVLIERGLIIDSDDVG